MFEAMTGSSAADMFCRQADTTSRFPELAIDETFGSSWASVMLYAIDFGGQRLFVSSLIDAVLDRSLSVVRRVIQFLGFDITFRCSISRYQSL